MDSKLYSRAKIISEAYLTRRRDAEWETFFYDNDLGVPFSVTLAYNGTKEVTQYAEYVINDTWDYLCNFLDLPNDAEFEDIDTMIEIASLVQTLHNNTTEQQA